MTSKEELDKLFELAVSNDSCDLKKCKKCTFRKYCKKYERYETIKKDLEILEILKKHMWFSFHKELGFQVLCNEVIDLGNEEEFNLLKGRLEK